MLRLHRNVGPLNGEVVSGVRRVQESDRDDVEGLQNAVGVTPRFNVGGRRVHDPGEGLLTDVGQAERPHVPDVMIETAAIEVVHLDPGDQAFLDVHHLASESVRSGWRS